MKHRRFGSSITLQAALITVAMLLSWIAHGRAETIESSDRDERSDVGEQRVIQFSGFAWHVKNSTENRKMGPGPNYWSESDRNVWVDDQGRLHLRITREKDASGRMRWSCAEVISEKSFGYGKYMWQLDTPIQSQPKIVLGLFTWDDAPDSGQFHHREIDVELFSTWGETNGNRNAQFCVQPYMKSRNLHRFSVAGNAPSATTHLFTWSENSVAFRSFSGHIGEAPTATAVLNEWRFSGSGVPPAGGENVRMNLWLLGPLDYDAKEPEVIISKFLFEPVADQASSLPAATSKKEK